MTESDKRRLAFELQESGLLEEIAHALRLDLFEKWAGCEDGEELARIHAQAGAVENIAQAVIRKANEYRHERAERAAAEN